MQYDACFSGSWYDSENPGEGINVEVLEDAIIVYFYDQSGEWTFFQGDENGLDMYQPWANGVGKVGDGYLIVIDDNTIEFGFNQRLDLRDVTFQRPIPWCLRSDCAREYVFERLTQPIPCASQTEVTGGGTGAPEVTGGGTGAQTQVTGNGTGAQTQVTGNGTGKEARFELKVTGGGTGRE